MSITFETASKKDIEQLVSLRLAYMIDDFGSITEAERLGMEKQLPDYFNRKLGTELIAFVAKDGEKIVSAAYLHIIEMPASPLVLTGTFGKVLSVYTIPEYRGNGLCSQLISNLIDYGRNNGLNRIDLSATKLGYPIYKKAGFVEKDNHYTEMRITF